jgi:hypothetical protein
VVDISAFKVETVDAWLWDAFAGGAPQLVKRSRLDDLSIDQIRDALRAPTPVPVRDLHQTVIRAA